MKSAQHDPNVTYDIAIVGCGPVGATIANLLAPYGFRIVVLEQEKAPFDKPRAIAADHEMLRTLQKCKLPDALASYIEPYAGSLYINEAGDIIKKSLPLPPPFPLGWPPTATFVQPELEGLLRRGMAQHANVELRLMHRVDELAWQGPSASLVVRDIRTSETYALHARYIIACDGASSSVRRTLKPLFEDLQFDEHWLVVDAWLRKPTTLPETSVQYCWPSRPATFVLGPRNLRRWELKLLPGESVSEFEKSEDILRHLAPLVDTSAIELWRASVYRFHALVSQQWRFGNVLLAGDAAHQSPPFAGQGLCSGIRDAANLCWRLLQVEKYGASDSVLNEYEVERKPHVRAVTALAKANGTIMGELDPVRASARDVQLKAALAAGNQEIYRQKLIPGLTAGLIGEASAGNRVAGSLFIQPRVRDASGAEAQLEDFLGMEFLIVSSRIDAFSGLTADAWAKWRRLGGRCLGIVAAAAPRPFGGVVVFQDLDGQFATWFEPLNALAVIVRPDRYVYAAAPDSASLNDAVDAIHAKLNQSNSTPEIGVGA